jgi:hypothetical protein
LLPIGKIDSSQPFEMLPTRVVLADLQGHHEWKALAILKMAGSRFSSDLAFSTPAFDFRLQAVHLAFAEDRKRAERYRPRP